MHLQWRHAGRTQYPQQLQHEVAKQTEQNSHLCQSGPVPSASHLLATHCAACATETSPGGPLGASAPVASACKATTARRSASRPVSAHMGPQAESHGNGPGG